MIEDPKFNFAIVISTNLYAGNFARELCAYSTGALAYTDDVGGTFADQYKIESPLKFQNITEKVGFIEDRGCSRPVSIWGEDSECTSLIIFFDERPTSAELKHIAKRVHAFSTVSVWERLEIKKIELIKQKRKIVYKSLLTLFEK